MGGQAHLSIRNHAALLVLLGFAAAAWYFTSPGLPGHASRAGDNGVGNYRLPGGLDTDDGRNDAPGFVPFDGRLSALHPVHPKCCVRAARTVALVTGYLVAWAVFGAVAFAAAQLATWLAMGVPDAAPGWEPGWWGPRAFIK